VLEFVDITLLHVSKGTLKVWVPLRLLQVRMDCNQRVSKYTIFSFKIPTIYAAKVTAAGPALRLSRNV
jgi:hypothetical protein